MTDPSGKLFLRIPEAAERLGIGRSTLYELLAAGEIKRVKIGARVLVPVEEIAAFARRKRAEAADDAA